MTIVHRAERLAQLADDCNEKAIAAAYRHFVAARDTRTRSCFWNVMVRLVKTRSSGAISRLELKRGLVRPTGSCS
jgi:hypothetical protein